MNGWKGEKSTKEHYWEIYENPKVDNILDNIIASMLNT